MSVEPEIRTVPFTLYRFWGAERRPGLWWALLDKIWPGLFWIDVLLYIGMTGRWPFKRLIEHVTDKDWAWRMRGWDVDPRSWPTEVECLAAEKRAIQAERPVHNIQHAEAGGTPNRRGPRWKARRRWRNRLIAGAIGWTAFFVAAAWIAEHGPLYLPAIAATAALGWVAVPRVRRASRR